MRLVSENEMDPKAFVNPRRAMKRRKGLLHLSKEASIRARIFINSLAVDFRINNPISRARVSVCYNLKWTIGFTVSRTNYLFDDSCICCNVQGGEKNDKAVIV